MVKGGKESQGEERSGNNKQKGKSKEDGNQVTTSTSSAIPIPNTTSSSTSSSSSSPSASCTPSSPNPNIKVKVSSPRSSISATSTSTVNPAAATVARRSAWRSSISGNPPSSSTRSNTSTSNNTATLIGGSNLTDSDSSTSQSSSDRLSGGSALHTTNSATSSSSSELPSSMDSDQNEPSHIQINSSSTNKNKLTGTSPSAIPDDSVGAPPPLPPLNSTTSSSNNLRPSSTILSTTMDQDQSNWNWDRINSSNPQQTPPGTMSLIPPFGSPTSLAPILVSGGGSTGPVLRRGQSQIGNEDRGRDWGRNWDRGESSNNLPSQSKEQSFGKPGSSSTTTGGGGRWGEIGGLFDSNNAPSTSSYSNSSSDSLIKRSFSSSQPPGTAPPQQINSSSTSSSSSSQSPLSQSRTNNSPSTSSSKMEGDEYDWANFVFAYSRGRWDPNRLPRPPGRSTAHPGVLTRIEPNGGVTMTVGDESSSSFRGQDLVAQCGTGGGGGGRESEIPVSEEPELQAMRRPSLTYVQKDGSELSDQSISSIKSSSNRKDGSQDLSTDSSATISPSTSRQQITSLTPVGPTAAGDSIGKLMSRTPPPTPPPQDSELNPFHGSAPPDRGDSLPPAPSPHIAPLTDAYALAHAKSSHSSPNALATTHAAIVAQEAHQNIMSSSFASKKVGGSRSTPEGFPTRGSSRQPLLSRTSDPARRIEDDIWHTTPSHSSSSRGQEQVSDHHHPCSSSSERPHLSTSNSTSAFQPLAGTWRGPPASSISAPTSVQTHPTTTTSDLRPALLSQFSALSLGSSGSGSDQTNVTIHAGDSSKSESDGGPPSRPGPTPVQDPTPENSEDLLEFLAPTSTRSAPEVPLSGIAAILRRNSDVEDRENLSGGIGGDARELNTSIAALRRAAARRTSVAKELSSVSRHSSYDNGKGKQVIHSSSFPGTSPSSTSTSNSNSISTRSIDDLRSDTTNSNEYLLQLSSPPSSARFSSQSVEMKAEGSRGLEGDSQSSAVGSDREQQQQLNRSEEVISDAEPASPMISKMRASSSNDPKRRALPPLGTPTSPITSRARTTSDLVRQPSGGGGGGPPSGIEGSSRNGNGNQTSPTSPAVKSYLAAGRRAENFYKEHGYLPSILPPNELERRQALRRYGPPKVAANVNFDRIAHLVKLVFNTKLVLISLVGENEQIFQTEMGGGGDLSLPSLQKSAGARDCSFCAHSILQDGDEPIVVLDTWRDWRFAGNPLVLGSPHIRFYCGCPLRTPDGFNLGSLCIIDDKPWTEFNPRQRHTLKEFARVVMREMELMRDQIQLGMRDQMQNSIELFTRECLEVESEDVQDSSASSTHGGESTTGSTGANPVGLHRVYDLAAKSMQDALQASGAIIFDLSHFELVDSFAHEGGSGGKIFFPSPYSNPGTTPFASFDNPSNIEATTAGEGSASASKPTDLPASKAESLKGKTVPPMAILGASEDCEFPPERENAVPLSHHIKVAEFLRSHRTGHYFPFSPSPFSQLLPSGVTNLMLVPIFGLNKQPFALLCAYAQGTESGTALEELKDSGLQYLRALGMIILSAVLKKDIMLADKAKSHFISNISHELRTPLHGILAAAELLSETKLDVTQDSYLDTVEACGKSLLELVNHVLDFTKLSGGASVDRQHSRSQCDLVKLVQEVCESSWIGQMAKALESQQQSGIGSVYAPPSGGAARSSLTDESTVKKLRTLPVETVIDVSMRSSGWLVNCDTGGIRRVLMNLIGNSLKFTSKGFVHVAIREVQSSDTHIIVELGVTDTGRGISRTFLEEQLFHPFTQENTLGTGTGLGLSIVNSIVQSPSINGKIDVWSTVGQGTEIRVTCELELCSPDDAEGTIYIPALDVQKQRTFGFLGFDESRGQENLREVISGYFEDWWHFAQVRLEGDQMELVANPEVDLGDIVLINENVAILEALKKRRSPLPPAIFLTSARGDAEVAAACDSYHQAGGVARMLFKPAGPAKLEAVVDFCLQCLDRIQSGDPPASEDTDPSSRMPSPFPSPAAGEHQVGGGGGYFNVKERNRSSHYDEREDETPRDPSLKTPIPDLTTPRLTRPTNNDAVAKLRESSHHMSPEAPPDPSSSLIRRHSTEDRVVQARSGGIVMESQNSSNPSSHSYSRQSRPMLPARSITYHEPRLQKHVLVSPHGSNPLGSGGSSSSRKRSGGSGREEEQQDYFSRSISGQSTPSSPGSQISLEGGDGAVLKSALKGGSSSSSNASKKRMQILSVEDNAINRRVIAAFLSKMDIDFVEASNGEEGVQIFQAYPTNHFDVVLMDLSMPVLDGIGATAAIRKIEAERHEASSESKIAARKGSASSFASSISSRSGSQSSKQPRAKIFALTGRSSEEDKRKALATGADGYMVKPLSFKVLSSLLKMLAR